MHRNTCHVSKIYPGNASCVHRAQLSAYVNDVAVVDPVVRDVQDRDRVQQTEMPDVSGFLQIVVRQVQVVQELEAV